MNILHLDIETSPHTAYVWGLFKENVPIQRLIETGRTMCVAAKWHKKPGVIFLPEWELGHKEMMEGVRELLTEADLVVHYNGDKFDLPTINKEFVYYGLTPPAPYKSLDLYKIVRKNFRFPSNKLDYVAQQLGLGAKTAHEGFKLWVKCMEGDKGAQKKMETYNKRDVYLLEKLYKHLLPWVHNHPSYALYKDSNRPLCSNCGSHHLHSRGYAYTKTMRYRRWECQSCGKWMRSRVNENTENQKANTLVDCN